MKVDKMLISFSTAFATTVDSSVVQKLNNTVNIRETCVQNVPVTRNISLSHSHHVNSNDALAEFITLLDNLHMSSDSVDDEDNSRRAFGEVIAQLDDLFSKNKSSSRSKSSSSYESWSSYESGWTSSE